VAPISPNPPPRSTPHYVSNYPNLGRRQKLFPGKKRKKKLLFHTSRKALIFFSPPSPPSSFLIAAARQIASRTNILVYSRTTFNAGWDILVFLSSKFSVKRRWMSWVESGCCSSVGISGVFARVASYRCWGSCQQGMLTDGRSTLGGGTGETRGLTNMRGR